MKERNKDLFQLENPEENNILCHVGYIVNQFQFNANYLNLADSSLMSFMNSF